MSHDRLERIWFDRLSAAVLGLFLAPLMVCAAFLAIYRTGRVFDYQSFVGIHGEDIVLRRFAGITRGRDFARILDIAEGKLAWVGSLPHTRESYRRSELSNDSLPHLRPGFISIWRLQRLTGSQYKGTNKPADYPNHTLKASLTIIVRYVFASALSGSPSARCPDSFEMLGVSIDNITIKQAIERIADGLNSSEPSRFAFVNPDCLNIAIKYPAYKSVLAKMDTVFADGIGIRIGCRMLGIRLKDNVNGTDLFPLICQYASKHGKSIYLLGGGPGVTDKVIEKTSAQFPELRFAGNFHGYFDSSEEHSIIENINHSNADILLVAFGAPKQELWLNENRDRLRIPVQIGVGGLFDFYSERISRSPRWLRDIGLEWTWRLLQEPGRMWRRYIIGIPLFLYQVRTQAKSDIRRKILSRFSNIDTGFFKASIRYRIRHFAWTFALFTARATRRLLDIAISATALLMLSPFLLFFAGLIKLESPGSCMFSQSRVGLWGKYFTMYKFRSMCTDAEEKKTVLLADNEMEGGVLFKMKDDPRVTRVGSFIRKYSIDELPQFWNVLRGDMSLVGPRPPVPSEVDQYSINDRRRLEIKPGLTCVWQISGRSEIAFEDQVELDVEYIESQSLLQDFKILVKTIPAVLLGKGSY